MRRIHNTAMKIDVRRKSQAGVSCAEGCPENVGVRGAESTLTAIMAQMAVDEKREVTWDEVIRG